MNMPSNSTSAHGGASTGGQWVQHNGNGRPVPVGTLVEVEMFNGVRCTITAGTGTHDLDGNPIPDWRSAGWSAWNFNDGGPMAPKFKRFRLAIRNDQQARDTAMFSSWLKVQEGELV